MPGSMETLKTEQRQRMETDRTDEYDVNTTAERYDTERRDITVKNIKQVNTRRGS